MSPRRVLGAFALAVLFASSTSAQPLTPRILVVPFENTQR